MNSEQLPEARQGLPRKPKNKIRDTLRFSCGEETAQSIVESIELKDYSLDEMSKVNQNLPRVCEILLSGRQGVTEVQTDDLKPILEIFAIKIARGESFDDICLFIGMGGTIDQPNVRLPAYLVSAIKMIDGFYKLSQEQKIIGIPRVRVMKATNLSASFNKFDLEQVRKVTSVTFDFLRKFLNEFFPHLLEYFEFVEDEPVNDERLEEIQTHAKTLEAASQIDEDIGSIVKMGEKHGGKTGKQNALLYAAAHPVYCGAVSKAENNISVIIELGGRPQSKFNSAARVIIESAKSDSNYKTTPICHVLMKAGKIPVYYQSRDSDIPLDKNFEKIDIGKVDTGTHMDYKEIFTIVDKDEFESFVKRFIEENEEQLDTISSS